MFDLKNLFTRALLALMLVSGAGVAFGDVSGSLVSNLVFGNVGGCAALLQMANLGGTFGFDLRFDVAPAGDSTSFGIALYNVALDPYLGSEGKLAQSCWCRAA